MTPAIMRTTGLCSYVDSILNQRAAFDMVVVVAIEAVDVDP